MFLAVLHVVGKHLNNLLQLKLPCSAELEEEAVDMPRVVRYVVGLDPLFELLETFLLSFAHIILIAKPMSDLKGDELTLMAAFILARLSPNPTFYMF